MGKTALLEALWMLSAPDLPGELTERLGELRGLPSHLDLTLLFMTCF